MSSVIHTLERVAVALERIATALEARTLSVVSSIAPAALSKEDAARFLGVEVGAIEHLIRIRKLEYVQHGSQRGRVIPVEGLRKFLEEHCQKASDLPNRKRRR
jgi:hypothetical protein